MGEKEQRSSQAWFLLPGVMERFRESVETVVIPFFHLAASSMGTTEE